jgi:hypothetical protein
MYSRVSWLRKKSIYLIAVWSANFMAVWSRVFEVWMVELKRLLCTSRMQYNKRCLSTGHLGVVSARHKHEETCCNVKHDRELYIVLTLAWLNWARYVVWAIYRIYVYVKLKCYFQKLLSILLSDFSSISFAQIVLQPYLR